MNKLLLLTFALACNVPVTDLPIVTTDPTPEPNPLTFGAGEGDPDQLNAALQCATTRVIEATCLPIEVSTTAFHVVRQKPAEGMGNRRGWTTGKWHSARIALKAGMDPELTCDVLVHEIAQHVLRRKNDEGHIEPTYEISPALLEDICTIQECGCFSPE